jgi:MHS family proline/betaine transporter-like MFS transporter
VLVMEAALSREQMWAWGWRVPFFVPLPLGLVGLFLRTGMRDSPVFQECKKQNAIKGTAWNRLVDLLSDYRRPIFVMSALVVALNVADYTLLAYQPTYLHFTIGLGEESRTIVILVGQLAIMACIPFLAGCQTESDGNLCGGFR